MEVVCELDVTLSYDPEMPDSPERYISELLMISIRECLTRCNHYTLTSMYAHGIDILHITHGDTVIIHITDDFVLELFPSDETLIDDDLMRVGKGFLQEWYEFRA